MGKYETHDITVIIDPSAGYPVSVDGKHLTIRPAADPRDIGIVFVSPYPGRHTSALRGDGVS